MSGKGRIIKIYTCNVADSYGTVRMCDGKELEIVGSQGGVFLNWILIDDRANVGEENDFCRSVRCRNAYRRALLESVI